MHKTTDAIIVAAGTGSRLKHLLPKAFVPLGGFPLFYHSLKTFSSHPAIRNIILVVSTDRLDETRTFLRNKHPDDNVILTIGGAERWESVSNGVAQSDAEWVLVHDAARPLVSFEVIDGVLEKRKQYDCVITATPEVDTIRLHDGDCAGEVVDRSKLIRVGTPQLFRRSKLAESFSLVKLLPHSPTDEAHLMQLAGVPVGYSCGDPLNFKVTTPSDLLIAEALIAHQSQ